MALATSNRDGGRTNEAGHLRAIQKVIDGEVLTGLAISQRAAGANMSVDIAVGDAVIPRSDDSYGHPAWNDALLNQSISAADGSNPRRDLVVMYIDYDETPSTGVSNNVNGVVKIAVVAGTPAGSPTDPDGSAIESAIGAGNPYIILARVRVAAAASSISNSVIDDLRVMATGINNQGWVSVPNSELSQFSYSAWTSGTRIGVITVPTNATLKYSVGNRLRIVQSTGGTKYGIIVAVSSTTLTVFFPSGTTFNNESILKADFSIDKAPFGFPLDPTIWTITGTSSTDRTATTTSYTSLSETLVVGIGAWLISYRLDMRLVHGSGGNKRGYITLSTNGTSETDEEFTSTLFTTSTTAQVSQTFVAFKHKIFAAQTTLTFMGKINATAATMTMDNNGTQPAHYKALCAYL